MCPSPERHDDYDDYEDDDYDAQHAGYRPDDNGQRYATGGSLCTGGRAGASHTTGATCAVV